MSKILVTGGSGFIGSHCLVQLLANGHEVRTTVRTLHRESLVQGLIKEGGWAGPDAQLTVLAADLESDGGWPAAVSVDRSQRRLCGALPKV